MTYFESHRRLCAATQKLQQRGRGMLRTKVLSRWHHWICRMNLLPR